MSTNKLNTDRLNSQVISKDMAYWQYLLDHATARPEGSYRVVVYLKSRNDLEGKIRARMKGKYRYDERDMEVQLEKKWLTYLIDKRKNDKMGKAINEIDQKGSLKDKAVVFLYRKTRDYLRKL